MRYIRFFYMCPKCNWGEFFNKDDEFSTKCPNCNAEMSYVCENCTSTEAEEREERMRNLASVVKCPYCNSLNTKKISATSKVVNTAMFGIFGTKRYKQWHCNSCGSDF